jgi:hypothetical protein
MMNAKLQAMFDIIVENFDPNDDVSVENTNYEMHENWQSFLEAGFDVDSVVKMMSLMDIWEHYEELLAYGAELDASKLFLTFKEFFNQDFTEKHWKELVGHGVSPDLLVDRRYANCGIFDTADLKDSLKRGVSAKKAFELVESWLELRKESPEEQIEILNLLHEHGLPKANVKEWLEKHTVDSYGWENSYMKKYVIEHEAGMDFYKKFGMKDNDVFDSWLDCWMDLKGWKYFDGCSLSDLPDAIGIDAFINYHSMGEIIENSSGPHYSDGFKAFISDYLANGKDIDVLAKKLMDDDISCYPSNSSEFGAMFDLVHAGSSTDIIDPVMYIEEVDVSRLNDDDAKYWYDYLKKEGYDSQLINKFLR